MGVWIARQVVTHEDIRLFTPPSADASEREKSVGSESTRIAREVCDQLSEPVSELRRHAFYLLAEMYFQEGKMVHLFPSQLKARVQPPTRQEPDAVTAEMERELGSKR